VQWKTQLQERATDLFMTAADRKATNGLSVKELHAKIGQRGSEDLVRYNAVFATVRGLGINGRYPLRGPQKLHASD
jgi:hypothetical protein